MESYRIGNLPEELVHEILLRLPVKALLVCKCVCKEWCALIKSPSFVNRHFSHENNQDYLFFHLRRYECEIDKPFPFLMYQDDDERHSLVEEPNHLPHMPTKMITEGLEKGILCLRFRFHLGLFNPATREFKTLPPIPQIRRRRIKARPWIGFGLDPCSGDFKVVAFKQTDYCNYAFVYNLSSDSWKTIETMYPYDKISYSLFAIGIPTFNGVKHWLIKFDKGGVYSILAFDMRSEKFQEIAIPDALTKTGRSLRITAYCDSIAVMSFEKDECIDLWVMGRDGLWSKSFSIGPFQENAWPLGVWKKNKVFFESSFSHLIMYDVSTQKVSTLIIPEPGTYNPFIYKERLVSIKGDHLQGEPCLDLRKII